MSQAPIQARFRKGWQDFTLDVDLQLPGRGITALFGHSGSGKTTLLRCFAGLGSRPQGRCLVNGEVWQDEHQFLPTHRRAIGYVFQDANLFPHLSVLKNLRYGQSRSRSAPSIALDQAITLLGIEHLLHRKPAELSGGEKQRVGIARALAVSPQLLLMDEPLAALDLARKREILPYLETLHDELQIPILYVTHSPDEVARLADHLVVMSGGRALAQGPLTELLSRLDLPIRLGEEAGVVLEGRVCERESRWNLARLAFAGGSLWARDLGHELGHQARLRVLARDVSLSHSRGEDTSILNALPARVSAIADDTHPAQALVRLDVGNTPLIARLTKRSAAQLAIQPGMELWAHIKAVALIG